MGGLINTKGTQRLSKLFNNRFNPLSAARIGRTRQWRVFKQPSLLPSETPALTY